MGDARITTKRTGWAVAVWLFGVAVVVAVRYRGRLGFVRAVHGWMEEAGIPEPVRTLDYTMLMLGSALLAASLVWAFARRFHAPGPLGLLLVTPPRAGWLRVSLIGAAPMVLGGLVLMIDRRGSLDWADLMGGVVRAPIVEEVFFRGLLVAVPAALMSGGAPSSLRGPRFWWLAVASGLVFGSVHVTWTMNGLASGWPSLLVTAVGGVWYAWLMRSWRSAFVPMLLHAAMNLGWQLAGSSGGAGGGGLVENLLRAATIALTTWLTIRTLRGGNSP